MGIEAVTPFFKEFVSAVRADADNTRHALEIERTTAEQVIAREADQMVRREATLRAGMVGGMLIVLALIGAGAWLGDFEAIGELLKSVATYIILPVVAYLAGKSNKADPED